tara:strand:- start:4880 stop:5254 length:375 start_codon:yes stop_codon:yes gene_type:complete
MRNGRGVKTSPTLFKERDMKKLLTEDRVAGKKTYFQTEGDDTHVVTEQKVDHILEHNKRQANDWKSGSMIGNTQHHHQKVAEIPATLYYDLVKKLGDPRHNLQAWKKWLNDPENRFFRSTGGTV